MKGRGLVLYCIVFSVCIVLMFGTASGENALFRAYETGVSAQLRFVLSLSGP